MIIIIIVITIIIVVDNNKAFVSKNTSSGKKGYKYNAS